MDPHETYFRSLSREEVHLVALKKFLYEGSWDEIVKDLIARKEGKPYIYKLDTRIVEDLDRIKSLKEYERRTDVDLGTYLHLYKATNTGK